jgi:hypothetical protein
MLKITFLVHGIVAVVLGVLLLGVPGRFLPVLGWAPVDPIMARLLGAAFLALAWGDFRGWRALSWSEVNVFVEVQLAFAALASVGLLRHLLSSGGWPAMIWILFGVFVLFAVVWLVVLLSRQEKQVPA